MLWINFQYQGFDAVFEMLERVNTVLLDFGDLPETFRQIMIDDNIMRALAGQDLRGVDMVPILPESYRGRKGTGPPLSPEGGASELVAGYEVHVYKVGDGEVDVIGMWPYMPQLTYHVTGYLSRGGNWVPARNPVGLTPYGQELVANALQEWIAKTFGVPSDA